MAIGGFVPPESRLGQRVGAYALERLVGRGGMSVVYFARERKTGRPAAVKILHRDLPENIDADRRLRQEARAISRIDHPHVVKVFDFGFTPDDLPYLAMEYLEGVQLSHIFIEGEAVPVGRMLDIGRQMLEGLQQAHELGIIHRDIKPDNVLLVRRDGQDDFVKMLDFGIAKLRGQQPHSLVHTVRGVVLGTPEYLPPEIAMDLEVSPATDLYATGVLLFEGLTGRLPFQGRGAGELAEHHCFTPPPRLRSFNRAIPAELERVVLRCLAKDPKKRYQTAAEFNEALSPFLADANAAQTLVSGPMGLGFPETELASLGPSMELFERVIREEMVKRWAAVDRPPPGALKRSVERVDELRERLLERETELAVVEDQLADVHAPQSDLDRELERLLAEERRLEDELAHLQGEEETRGRELAEGDQQSSVLLGELLPGERANTRLLQSLLSPEHIERTVEWIRFNSDRARGEELRRSLLERIEATGEARAVVLVRRATLQGEIGAAEARRGADRLRKQLRRKVVRAEIATLRRAHAQALYQCALDLAVAVGNQ